MIVRASVPFLLNETEGIMTEMKNLLLTHGGMEIPHPKPIQLMDLLDFLISPNHPYPLIRLVLDETWQRRIVFSPWFKIPILSGDGETGSSANYRDEASKTSDGGVVMSEAGDECGEDLAGTMPSLRSEPHTLNTLIHELKNLRLRWSRPL